MVDFRQEAAEEVVVALVEVAGEEVSKECYT